MTAGQRELADDQKIGTNARNQLALLSQDGMHIYIHLLGFKPTFFATENAPLILGYQTISIYATNLSRINVQGDEAVDAEAKRAAGGGRWEARKCRISILTFAGTWGTGPQRANPAKVDPFPIGRRILSLYRHGPRQNCERSTLPSMVTYI